MDRWSNIRKCGGRFNRDATDVLYQPQKANGVAHALAQYGLKEGTRFLWTNAAPPRLDSILWKIGKWGRVFNSIA
ncbi:hypothetical protein GBA52_010257 [Prunus armeniaca]|nr:hypothetical protein GBA52_010257 [Prunus armeniaca]